ncbi:hypothetical protein G6F32_015035 [Rhizopus arrhizus]|nr:hypothetical protein G6F32_015035 [Rhizopus arrhizus]
MLVLADGDADAIASQLQRFVFRRKVKVLVRSELAVAGAFTAPEAASGAAIAHAAGDGWELDLGSDALPRTLRIGATDAFAAGSEADEAAFALAWRQADLRYGLPRLEESQREREEGLLPGPGDRRPHPLPRQGQARGAAAACRGAGAGR